MIKVEAPEGDPFRKSGEATLGGDGVFFLSLNRNKRGIVVDLKTEQGRAVVRELAMQADVVVENFRPGQAEKLGIGYDELRGENPRLIYCSISGFGRSGPNRDRPALDQVMQAFSGIMSITGEPGGQPVRARRCRSSTSPPASSARSASPHAVHPARAHRARPARRRLAPRHRRERSSPTTPRAICSPALVPKALGSGHPSLSPYRNFKCRRRAVDLHRRRQ